MKEKRKGRDISGWYGKEEADEQERRKQAAEIEAWYEKKLALNYRTVSVEVPGKMLEALGRLAAESKKEFSDFIESILAEYLEGKGVRWN